MPAWRSFSFTLCITVVGSVLPFVRTVMRLWYLNFVTLRPCLGLLASETGDLEESGEAGDLEPLLGVGLRELVGDMEGEAAASSRRRGESGDREAGEDLDPSVDFMRLPLWPVLV